MDESILSTCIAEVAGPSQLSRPSARQGREYSLPHSGSFTQQPLHLALTQGWTANQTKSLSLGHHSSGDNALYSNNVTYKYCHIVTTP